MHQSEIGVAVVGTGFGQKVHIPAFKAHHRTQVVAVYHRDLQKAQAIAQSHGIPHACSSMDEILAVPEVEAVSISTPPFLHYAQANATLEAGKHLLLEKPVTLEAAEAEALYNLAQQKALSTSVNFEFRCIPAWIRLAELLGEGYVGNLRFVKIDWMVSSRADATRPWNWYSQVEKGGGALGAIGSHAFDYIAWLFGPVQRLSARLSVTVPQRPDPETGALKPVDADDTGQIMLELSDRIPCQVTLATAVYQGRGHWVEVYGDRGTLILGSDNQKDYVHGFRLWGSQQGAALVEQEIPDRLAFPKTYEDGRIAPFIRVVDRWVQSIDSRQPVVPSLKEGLYSQKLMDLSHESNQTGRWVEVTD